MESRLSSSKRQHPNKPVPVSPPSSSSSNNQPGSLNFANLSTKHSVELTIAGHLSASLPISRRLEEVPPLGDSATLKTRRGQLRDAIQSTAFDIFDCSHGQHRDLFDDNDAIIGNLLGRNHRLQMVYMDHRTDLKKETFLRYCSFAQRRLQEMQEAEIIRKAEEIRAISPPLPNQEDLAATHFR
ncbi:hypothetical protein SprV_0301375500 [Sparganum proliferum]